MARTSKVSRASIWALWATEVALVGAARVRPRKDSLVGIQLVGVVGRGEVAGLPALHLFCTLTFECWRARTSPVRVHSSVVPNGWRRSRLNAQNRPRVMGFRGRFASLHPPGAMVWGIDTPRARNTFTLGNGQCSAYTQVGETAEPPQQTKPPVDPRPWAVLSSLGSVPHERSTVPTSIRRAFASWPTASTVRLIEVISLCTTWIRAECWRPACSVGWRPHRARPSGSMEERSSAWFAGRQPT